MAFSPSSLVFDDLVKSRHSGLPVPGRQVKTGVQRIYNYLKELDSGACPGPDPGFAGMTERRIFRLFTNSSFIPFL